jgi:hypothetical protein
MKWKVSIALKHVLIWVGSDAPMIRKQETFLYEYPLHWVLLPTEKRIKRTLLFCSICLNHGSQFDYWNQPLIMSIHVCYLDCHEAGLCCSSDTYRKPITSTTAALLPFVTYILTLPLIIQWDFYTALPWTTLCVIDLPEFDGRRVRLFCLNPRWLKKGKMLREELATPTFLVLYCVMS